MNSVILFDLGNTIVNYHVGKITDEEKEIIGLWNMLSTLKKFNVLVSFDVLFTQFYQPWLEVLPFRNQQKKEYDLKPFLSQIIDLNRLTDDHYKELLIQFYEPFSRFAISPPGLQDTLTVLQKKGYKIGLVSNTPVPGFCHDLTLKNLNLFNYFDFRLYSYDVGIRKPNPEIFQKALTMSNCSSNNALMVGDSYELDIKIPIKLGFKTILFAGIKKQFGGNLGCKQFTACEDLIPAIDLIFNV